MTKRKAKLEDLIIDKVALCQQGANQYAEVAFFKSAEYPTTDATVSDNQHVEVAVSEETTADLPEAATDVEAPEAQADESGDVSAEIEEVTDEPAVEADADGSAEQPAPELVAASADPVEKAEMVDVEKAALAKALADAQAEIAKMKHEARSAEFIAKAKADFENIGPANEVGPRLLEAADRMSPEGYQWVERTLKAANAQLASGDLFKQLSDPAAEPAAVEDKITQLAKAKVEAGEAKTIEIGKLLVVREHPELLAEYQNAPSA